MNLYATTGVQNIISPSMRFGLRQKAAWLREQPHRACLWQWEVVKLPYRQDCPYELIYAGRKGQRELGMRLLGIKQDGSAARPDAGQSLATAYISEMPIPGALRVPCYVTSIVSLRRTLEEIVAEYPASLRQILRSQQKLAWEERPIVDDAEIERIDREMLRPYATATHGERAVQIEPDEVRRIARNYGRFVVLYLDQEAVACRLEYTSIRAGKRYWVENRKGFPEAVFLDSKRLRKISSISSYFGLKLAIENGHDYFDLGLSLARPEDGVLQWKRTRGGAVDATVNHSYFYVRLPRIGQAQFLWDSPLFAREGSGLTLWLGLPAGQDDEKVLARYRELRFGGLSKVYLLHGRQPGEPLLKELQAMFTDRLPFPAVACVAAP